MSENIEKREGGKYEVEVDMVSIILIDFAPPLFLTKLISRQFKELKYNSYCSKTVTQIS